jgi:hypothetical protein
MIIALIALTLGLAGSSVLICQIRCRLAALSDSVTRLGQVSVNYRNGATAFDERFMIASAVLDAAFRLEAVARAIGSIATTRDLRHHDIEELLIAAPALDTAINRAEGVLPVEVLTHAAVLQRVAEHGLRNLRAMLEVTPYTRGMLKNAPRLRSWADEVCATVGAIAEASEVTMNTTVVRASRAKFRLIR